MFLLRIKHTCLRGIGIKRGMDCPIFGVRWTPKGDQSKNVLCVHPRHHLLQDTITKIVLDQGRGILLVPVGKQCPWFWTSREVALDWWDLDLSVPL